MAQFVNEAFTDSGNTPLASHPSSGASAPYAGTISTNLWRNTGGNGSAAVAINSNRIEPSGADATHGITHIPPTGFSPAGANYSVTANIRCITNTNTGFMGVAARHNGATNGSENRYYSVYNAYAVPSQWELYRTVSGTDTLLGTYVQALTTSTTYVQKLSCNGTTISVDIDGTNRISVTDSNVTAAGDMAIISYLAAGTSFDIAIESVTADDIGSTTYNKTLSVNHTGVVSIARVLNAVQSITFTLVTSPSDATPKTNLSNLRWAVWDQTEPNAIATHTPVNTGTSGSTNGSGVMTIGLPNTAKTSGGLVTVMVWDDTSATNIANGQLAIT